MKIKFETYTEEGFFFGANTPEGFCPAFDYHINENEFEKIFCIKGSSGCGKSTFIKKIGEKFENTVKLYCSSEPTSLDGIIINKNGKKTAIIDGTYPHIYDPHIPVATGEIIDFTPFISEHIVSGKKEELKALFLKKKEYYNKAYECLKKAAKFNEMKKRALLPHISYKAAQNKISEMLAHIKGEKGKAHFCRTLSFSAKGAVRLSPFDSAGNTVYIKDFLGASDFFFEILFRSLCEKEAEFTACLSPMGNISEIYIHENDTLISPYIRKGKEKINLGEFADFAENQSARALISLYGKCAGLSIGEALCELEKAGNIHSEIEKIYIPAVDFGKIDTLCEKTAEAILLYSK